MVTRSDIWSVLLFSCCSACACRGLPASARWASPRASFWVGCAWTRAATSSGMCLPVDDELGLADLLTHPGADHVHADDRAVLLADELDEALRSAGSGTCRCRRGCTRRSRPQPCRLAGLGLGQPDGGDLGVAVGDPRDARLVDHGRAEPGDLLGDEDALGEPAVRELQAGHDVADGVDALDAGAQALVGDHEAAVEP